MDKFVVGSDPAIQATFHSKRYGNDGWLDSYAIDLEAHDFQASVRIQNPGFGHPPTQLFNDMAVNWSGWKGKKFWAALDGELEIEATADAIGHVTLQLAITDYGNARLWAAQGSLLVEAGQLERLAHEAELFFAQRDA